MPTATLSPNGLDEYRFDAPPQAVLIATMDGVVELRSEDGTWSSAQRSLAGRHVSALLSDPAGERIYAGTHGDGLFTRESATSDWTLNSTGLTSHNVFTLACTSDAAGTIVHAGTEPARLFRSRDGARWDELPALGAFPTSGLWNFPAPPFVAHTKHVDFDPRDRRIMYVAIEQGALLKSTDGGETFRELHFQDASYVLNKDVHRVAINPLDPDELYVPGGDGISYSRDAGDSWTHIATPKMRIAYPDQLFCSTDTNGTIYVTGGGTSPDVWRRTGDANSTMARSRDHGRTWEELPLPARRGNFEAATMVAWPGGFGFFAGTSDGEVFWSGDRGESWTQIAAGLAPISKCIHHRNLSIGRGAA
jgi:hypothetical protein